MSNSELATRLLLQLLVILAACQVVGWLAQRVGQPRVVGEMVAGVLLGPSLLGLLLPGWKAFLFPGGASMAILNAVAHLGLVLYMFLVGLEFDVGLIRHRTRTAISVSAAGVGTPLVLGGLLALVLVRDPGRFFPPGVVPWHAMLFVGTAIAITAFPMLARIVVERGLAGTSLGTIALACAATDDAICWCLFAVLLAIVSGNPVIAVVALAGGAVYVLGTLTVGRRALARLGATAQRTGEVGPTAMTVLLVVLMAAAWFTEAIGIYSIFGAFVLGVAMPRGRFREAVRAKIGPLTTTFLLPLFFVYSGLNTQVGLVNSAYLWGITALVVVVSVLAKGAACYVAARLNREPPREAAALGSLMNARGLIELILLNVVLEAGVITPTLFTIFVLMAVITTLAATPLFELAHHGRRPVEAPSGPAAGERVGSTTALIEKTGE